MGMNFLTAGIDLGVQSVKLVVLNQERQILCKDSEVVRGNFPSALETIFRRNLASLSAQKFYSQPPERPEQPGLSA